MHYHLIGICGTAMASLAGMLQARGHRVTGSDENVYPPMSTMLESLGIPIMHGYQPVLATGRSLDEVRDRCTAYGLAGGVAEYGAFVYLSQNGEVHSLPVPADAQRAAAAARHADRRRRCRPRPCLPTLGQGVSS